jgi:CPA2 family monovalent cation:H+ antiporter-2
MTDFYLGQILFLLGVTVAVVLALQRLHVPTLLAYLVAGVLVGPNTPGPSIDPGPLQPLAEFGIVFLLFTIGLSFSIPQLHALRHVVLGMGTAQVVLSTAVVGVIAWLAGLPPAAAFVIGAVFAQSSTTIIGRQLAEQSEAESRHGRLSLAMSVFQDVTAVPFVIIIPALAAGALAAGSLGGTLALAGAKAVLALALVYAGGRWLLPPLFHRVAARRSAELFTLTVLLVSLTAAAITEALGLSMAFGAFLAGMMLGETQFRHQVESAIRPFRDVLLGLFFVGIGMLFDPGEAIGTLHWALAGALLLLTVKTALVTGIVRLGGIDTQTAWRSGLILAVGGEFGFALLAIALAAQVIEPTVGQIALSAVLLSMIAAPFLIRYNDRIARWLSPAAAAPAGTPLHFPTDAALLSHHVIICGYGRIGQNVGRFLEEEDIPYVALDLDPERVRQAHLAGERVFYADSSDPHILDAVGLASARLVVVSHDDVAAALKVLQHVRASFPELPVMVRTRDEAPVEMLQKAGAVEVVPETLEAGLMIATNALLLLKVPLARIIRRLRGQRLSHYHLLREVLRGEDKLDAGSELPGADRMRPVVLPAGGSACGCRLADLELAGVLVTALVRNGKRSLAPAAETVLEAGDVVVLFGPALDIEAAARRLLA